MQYIIIGMIKDRHTIVGYRLKSRDGNTVDVTKDQVIKLIEDGLVINAKVNMSNGSKIVRTKNKIPVCARVINKKEEVKSKIEKYEKESLVELLNKLDCDTPLKLTFTSVENYKQCIYLGSRKSPCGIVEYFFFDGRDFKFSENFILNNENIKIILNDIDNSIIEGLLKQVKGEE